MEDKTEMTSVTRRELYKALSAGSLINLLITVGVIVCYHVLVSHSDYRNCVCETVAQKRMSPSGMTVSKTFSAAYGWIHKNIYFVCMCEKLAMNIAVK